MAASQSLAGVAPTCQVQPLHVSSPRATVESCVDELLNLWEDAEGDTAKNEEGGEGRGESSPNEAEPISSLYAHVHPADDKHSKYALLALFPTVESVV
ncbi:hypothetical protein PINS_up000276 [Pythium insidiosum]|nr:hypothetical protein PINS_up000276 [Pythium insidiosum]